MSKKLYGLNPYTFPVGVQSYIDQDYINKLSSSEKEFLNKFNNEYYGNHIKKGDVSAFHSSDEQRRECRRRAYVMEYDLFSYANPKGLLEYLSEEE
jgi:hypothetical protein